LYYGQNEKAENADTTAKGRLQKRQPRLLLNQVYSRARLFDSLVNYDSALVENGSEMVLIKTFAVFKGGIRVFDNYRLVFLPRDVFDQVFADSYVLFTDRMFSQDNPLGLFCDRKVFSSQAADDPHFSIEFEGHIAISNGNHIVFAAIFIKEFYDSLDGAIKVVGNLVDEICQRAGGNQESNNRN